MECTMQWTVWHYFWIGISWVGTSWGVRAYLVGTYWGAGRTWFLDTDSFSPGGDGEYIR